MLVLCAWLFPYTLWGEQVTVRYTEGLLHAFIALRTLDGKIIALGDFTQTAAGDRVTSKLALHFKDGSIHEETTEFSQHDKFQVIKYRLVQKGPAFKTPSDTSIDCSSGQITVRYADRDGKEKVVSDRQELPPDIANGIVPLLMKNIQPSASQTVVSMLATTPKPRLVKLKIITQGEEPFSVGGVSRNAIHYIVKVEIEGVAGVVAPLVGKQPPDTSVWVLGGAAPVFLRSEGPLFEGGPIWRLEQIAPSWPRRTPANSPKP